jgi:DinB family
MQRGAVVGIVVAVVARAARNRLTFRRQKAEGRKGKRDDGEDAAIGSTVLIDGRVYIETTLGHMSWIGLFDAIHHRGQLSVYLRPMGGRVPSIYGPSADDPGL